VLWLALFGALALSWVLLRAHFQQGRSDVFVGPRLHERMEELFEPHLGQAVSPAVARELEAQANRLFNDVMTGVALVPDGWRVVVQNDEALGPVPRLQGPNGQLLDVAEFEQRVREGRLRLDETP
jgi:hypothetical protein